MSRLRSGELIAGVGGVGLFVVMFFDWFGFDPGPAQRTVDRTQDFGGGGILSLLNTYSTRGVDLDGWSTLGWFMVVLLCVQMLGAAALVYMTIRRASPAWPIGAGVLTWLVGSTIWVVLLFRVCITQPGVDRYIGVQLAAYLGLLFSALIPIGGLVSIRNERTRTPESLGYMPPPARTAPTTS
ncbi:hypothetical protein [Conexibacter woesei]|uniref:hypothetical protein n=1 Tax=Conexibacter woesei TaxID=191495 RepID=UPI0004249B04|nr:hypothetical protein [Conexibacter woesei]